MAVPCLSGGRSARASRCLAAAGGSGAALAVPSWPLSGRQRAGAAVARRGCVATGRVRGAASAVTAEGRRGRAQSCGAGGRGLGHGGLCECRHGPLVPAGIRRRGPGNQEIFGARASARLSVTMKGPALDLALARAAWRTRLVARAPVAPLPGPHGARIFACRSTIANLAVDTGRGTRELAPWPPPVVLARGIWALTVIFCKVAARLSAAVGLKDRSLAASAAPAGVVGGGAADRSHQTHPPILARARLSVPTRL